MLIPDADSTQVCRFHVDRGTARMNLPGLTSPFDDEVELKDQERIPWKDIGYKWQYRNRDPKEDATNMLADTWRVYCHQHMTAKKAELARMLAPGRLPGPLCTCNIYDRFVGRWLCIPCFEREKSSQVSYGIRRDKRWCSLDGCYDRAVRGWRQCGWCNHLIDPYVPKGHNAMHRAPDEM